MPSPHIVGIETTAKDVAHFSLRENSHIRLLPSEVEQSFGRWRDLVVGPRNEVKLRDGTGFVRLKVLQVETANDIVFTPDVLGDQVNLLQTTVTISLLLAVK